jgi:deoxyribonuclease-1-like protein
MGGFMIRVVATIVLVAVIVAGSWVLLHRDQIEHPIDAIDLAKQQLSQFQVASPSNSPVFLGSPGPVSNEPVVRIATFKLTGYETALKSPDLSLITDICRRYDAIALQGLDGKDDRWLKSLVAAMSSKSDSCEYHFIADLSANDSRSTQLAIVFNRRTLDLDPMHWYTVNDPDQLLQRPPLVGWFRTRMPNPQESFTFSLVNVELAASRPDLELAYLGDLYRAIRDDGRGEDDVIIAGDFNSGDRGFESAKKRAGLIWVVSNTPTDIKRKAQYDNLLFNENSTVEYTQSGGVFDFVRCYNLRLDNASRLSERMPVWAEFSAIEGRQIGRIANGSDVSPAVIH